MNSKGLNKLKVDLRDFSHHAAFGTLGAAQLPTEDFTIYDQQYYTVEYGDTLYSIANRFGYLMPQNPTITNCPLLAANPQIKDPNKIFVGDTITLPVRENTILNQTDLDFCSAYTTVELQSAIHGIQFDPYYQFAKEKQIRGEYTQYGADLRDACNSVIQYGSLPAILAPYTHNTGASTDQTRDFLANWANYPSELDSVAKFEEDLSYFTVDGPYDAFDNLRSTLSMHLSERRAITIGLLWRAAWTEAPGGIIPTVMPAPSSEDGGHDMAAIGQKTINGTMYIVLQQTWGPTAGDNGYYYFPRDIIDVIATEGYGMYTFSKLDGSGMTSSGIMGLITNFFNSVVGFFKK